MKAYDIVITGAYSAGLAAAVAARKAGISSILVIERDEEMGGILNQCIHNGFGLHTFQEELTEWNMRSVYCDGKRAWDRSDAANDGDADQPAESRDSDEPGGRHDADPGKGCDPGNGMQGACQRCVKHTWLSSGGNLLRRYGTEAGQYGRLSAGQGSRDLRIG